MKTLFCLFALIAVAAAMAAPSQELSGMGCLMCEVAVKVASDPTDKEAHIIEEKFNAECKKEFHAIPFMEKECEKYADMKLNAIINELEGGTAPQDVCKKLHEC